MINPLDNQNSANCEVAGSFLLGLVESFYNLRILPQGGVRLQAIDIDPQQWYPYSVLIDTLKRIEQAVPSSSNVFFRAGVNFLRIWYEHGPGKTMVHSGRDWLYANLKSGGYNSVVRGGSQNEIGWRDLLSIDEKTGVAVYENVTPLAPDFVRGVFYGGCMLFEDMEYVDVQTAIEQHAQNPAFKRILVTVRYRLKAKSEEPDLAVRIKELQPGATLALSAAEIDSLIWRFKGLQVKIGIDAAYYGDINNILAEAVTTTQKQRDEITYLSNHDSLTGLPNLRLARDRLTMACNLASRSESHTALLFIDLDGFKKINDTHGHEAGDYVLKAFAERLTGCIRKVDTAARQGGDEFLVILNCIADMNAPLRVAGKIVDAASTPIAYNGNQLKVGASIGIALFPDHAATPEALLKKADHAMYSVKKSGKNNFMVYASP